MLNNKVLTKEEQSKLTPDQVIKILKQGNQKFTNNNFIVKNNLEHEYDAVIGQHPAAVILSCIDSRVLVENVFNCGVGDVFVVRVAGNIVNSDILGSLEYACKESGSKLVVVMGHGDCGAVKAAIDNVELGNITGLLEKIKPAVTLSKVNYKGEVKSSNAEFVERVGRTHVELMLNEIRMNSPILKDMEREGEIKIVGATYSIKSGTVEFFEEK